MVLKQRRNDVETVTGPGMSSYCTRFQPKTTRLQQIFINAWITHTTTDTYDTYKFLFFKVFSFQKAHNVYGLYSKF